MSRRELEDIKRRLEDLEGRIGKGVIVSEDSVEAAPRKRRKKKDGNEG